VRSLFNELAAWFVIAAGTFCFALPLVRLTVGRAKPEMTKLGARSQAWRDLRYSLILIAPGVFLLADGWKHGTDRWLLFIFMFPIAIWNIGSQHRSRTRDESGQPTADQS
jgi:hypothetical protein